MSQITNDRDFSFANNDNRKIRAVGTGDAQEASNNNVDLILPLFDPSPLLCGQFLYPECGQKHTFFDPLPPHLVNVVIECPLSVIILLFFERDENETGFF